MQMDNTSFFDYYLNIVFYDVGMRNNNNNNNILVLSCVLYVMLWMRNENGMEESRTD